MDEGLKSAKLRPCSPQNAGPGRRGSGTWVPANMLALVCLGVQKARRQGLAVRLASPEPHGPVPRHRSWTLPKGPFPGALESGPFKCASEQRRGSVPRLQVRRRGPRRSRASSKETWLVKQWSHKLKAGSAAHCPPGPRGPERHGPRTATFLGGLLAAAQLPADVLQPLLQLLLLFLS